MIEFWTPAYLKGMISKPVENDYNEHKIHVFFAKNGPFTGLFVPFFAS